MNNIQKILVYVCIMHFTTPISFSQGWRGLTPLHSTCEDVKRILKVNKCELPISTYDLQDETVRINFAQYACHAKWPHDVWNVAPGTLIGIDVIPKRPLELSDILATGKYKTTISKHIIDEVSYSNVESGIDILTYKGNIKHIYYYPVAKDKHLRCSTFEDFANKYELLRLPSLFKTYGDLPFNKEKVLLDDYARNLQEYGADSRGYILVYAGRKAHLGEAQQRAKRAKDYVVSTHGIKASRIGTIDGGYHEELVVELHIGPPDMPAPIISPTIHPSEVRTIKTANIKNSKRRSTRSRYK